MKRRFLRSQTLPLTKHIGYNRGWECVHTWAHSLSLPVSLCGYKCQKGEFCTQRYRGRHNYNSTYVRKRQQKIPWQKPRGGTHPKTRRRSDKTSGGGGNAKREGRRSARPQQEGTEHSPQHPPSFRAATQKAEGRDTPNATIAMCARMADNNVHPFLSFPRSPRSPCRSYLDAVAQKPRTPSPRGGSCLQLFANSRVLRKRSGSCLQLFAKCPLSRKQAACLSGDLKVRHAFAE